MTTTPELINSLASGLRPAPRALLQRRLIAGVGVGALVSAAAVMALWGPRPDVWSATDTASFWIKFAFAGLLACCGVYALARLARPDGRAFKAGIGALAIVAAMAVLAASQLMRAPTREDASLILGETAAVCPWLIMLLAVPILAGALWAMRAMAPTRLRLAGAGCGLAAGGLSAFIDAISCDETAMPFVFVWYGLAIALCTAAGALLGRLALRW